MANMKQTNEKIESSLKKAFQNVAPDLMNSILADCENEKGRIITMTNEKKFSKILSVFRKGRFFAYEK